MKYGYIRCIQDLSLKDLIKNIEKEHNLILLGKHTIIEIAEEAIPAWEIDLKKIFLNNNEYKSSKDVSLLIDRVNAVFEIMNDPEAPKEIKALLDWHTRLSMPQMQNHKEDPFVEELFDRRNEMLKKNPARNVFIDLYLRDKLYTRFYKEKDDEMRAKGEDPDDHEFENEEEFEIARKKHFKHLDDIFREYGEKQVVDWKYNKDYLV